MLINLIAVYVILPSAVSNQQLKKIQKSLAISGKIKLFFPDAVTMYQFTLHEADITGKTDFMFI
jgi:hypothetical protein